MLTALQLLVGPWESTSLARERGEYLRWASWLLRERLITAFRTVPTAVPWVWFVAYWNAHPLGKSAWLRRCVQIVSGVLEGPALPLFRLATCYRALLACLTHRRCFACRAMKLDVHSIQSVVLDWMASRWHDKKKVLWRKLNKERHLLPVGGELIPDVQQIIVFS